jgi:hypothetical protein
MKKREKEKEEKIKRAVYKEMFEITFEADLCIFG